MSQLRLFDPVPPGTPIGHGFPSAHATCGFAFVALYFAAALFAPSRRFWFLAAAIALGELLGFVQQMRGAHFLSHDLFSLGICWLAAGGVYVACYPRRLMRFFRIGPR